MSRLIQAHPPTSELYRRQLVHEEVVTDPEVRVMVEEEEQRMRRARDGARAGDPDR